VVVVDHYSHMIIHSHTSTQADKRMPMLTRVPLAIVFALCEILLPRIPGASSDETLSVDLSAEARDKVIMATVRKVERLLLQKNRRLENNVATTGPEKFITELLWYFLVGHYQSERLPHDLDLMSLVPSTNWNDLWTQSHNAARVNWMKLRRAGSGSGQQGAAASGNHVKLQVEPVSFEQADPPVAAKDWMPQQNHMDIATTREEQGLLQLLTTARARAIRTTQHPDSLFWLKRTPTASQTATSLGFTREGDDDGLALQFRPFDNVSYTVATDLELLILAYHQELRLLFQPPAPAVATAASSRHAAPSRSWRERSRQSGRAAELLGDQINHRLLASGVDEEDEEETKGGEVNYDNNASTFSFRVDGVDIGRFATAETLGGGLGVGDDDMDSDNDLDMPPADGEEGGTQDYQTTPLLRNKLGPWAEKLYHLILRMREANTLGVQGKVTSRDLQLETVSLPTTTLAVLWSEAEPETSKPPTSSRLAGAVKIDPLEALVGFQEPGLLWDVLGTEGTATGVADLRLRRRLLAKDHAPPLVMACLLYAVTLLLGGPAVKTQGVRKRLWDTALNWCSYDQLFSTEDLRTLPLRTQSGNITQFVASTVDSKNNPRPKVALPKDADASLKFTRDLVGDVRSAVLLAAVRFTLRQLGFSSLAEDRSASGERPVPWDATTERARHMERAYDTLLLFWAFRAEDGGAAAWTHTTSVVPAPAATRLLKRLTPRELRVVAVHSGVAWLVLGPVRLWNKKSDHHQLMPLSQTWLGDLEISKAQNSLDTVEALLVGRVASLSPRAVHVGLRAVSQTENATQQSLGLFYSPSAETVELVMRPASYKWPRPRPKDSIVETLADQVRQAGQEYLTGSHTALVTSFIQSSSSSSSSSSSIAPISSQKGNSLTLSSLILLLAATTYNTNEFPLEKEENEPLPKQSLRFPRLATPDWTFNYRKTDAVREVGLSSSPTSLAQPLQVEMRVASQRGFQDYDGGGEDFGRLGLKVDEPHTKERRETEVAVTQGEFLTLADWTTPATNLYSFKNSQTPIDSSVALAEKAEVVKRLDTLRKLGTASRSEQAVDHIVRVFTETRSLGRWY
jgi:hypothetical protein